MIISLHRLTGYWLAADDQEGADLAKKFLTRIRQGRAPNTLMRGYIHRGYDPQALAPEPGYDWLRNRLRELREEPARRGELPFDGQPDAGTGPGSANWDPFPAFCWEIKTPGYCGLAGLIEVLTGQDIVVFHQAALQELDSENVDDFHETLKDLEQTTWVACHESAGALFTATLAQISDVSSPKDAFVSEWLSSGSTPPPFSFQPERIEYTLRLGFERTAEASSAPAFQGRVLVEGVRGAQSVDRVSLHWDVSGFIAKFATLLVNFCKVELEHGEADRHFPLLERALKETLAKREAKQHHRTWKLPEPLRRTEIAELQSLHRAAWKIIEQAGQLVDTCVRNTNQFAHISKQILHTEDPWARHTLLQLRQRNDQLEERHRSLDSKARWLWSDIEIALATGRLLANEEVPELLHFRASPQEKEGFETVEFPPLVMVGAEPARLRTIWHIADTCGTGDTDTWIPVRRPVVLQSDRQEDLTTLYLRGLRDCSADDLQSLLGALSSSEGKILLGNKDSEPLPVGNLFDLTLHGRAAQPSPLTKLADLLPARGRFFFAEVYAKTSCAGLQKEDMQDWLGFVSLLSFLEALVRLLADPPEHLAKVTRYHSAKRSRFLFLLGFLYVVARRTEESKDCWHRSVRAALADHDLVWSERVTEFFRKLELGPIETESRSPDPVGRQAQPWRERLASDFLDVYDLPSAAGLFREARSGESTAGSPPRAGVLRWTLWGLAFFIGAELLVSHALIERSALQETGREALLVSAVTVALLGAPLALSLGAGRASTRLFPRILFPRLLGAITLAAISFSATQETAWSLASAKPFIFGLLIAISLGGGALYLFSEIRSAIRDAKESIRRCLDIFSLAFLEAASISTVFALIYERMFSSGFRDAFPTRDSAIFEVHQVFIHPKTIFLLTAFSLFVGIVVHLMWEGDRGQERREAARG